MEQRATSWKLSVNERNFIEEAIQSDLRIDGRRSFDFRTLSIKFGSEDGSSEVQLGETHVMGYVTAQLVQPYRDRPREGNLSIFTEFSPMADPSFEPGKPGESAIELGRVVDRGLRESRAVDMESLCVVAGKSVWALRVDLHILDNGGNLIDAANIAALSAMSTFRVPECTVGGQDGDEVVVHDPQVREPLPLTIHHLPVAVTFAFFGEGNFLVIDPTFKEEAVMCGRMTVIMNANGDICAIQKPGGDGITVDVTLQCLRIAKIKAADVTSKIKSAVDSYNAERALKKVKRLPGSVPQAFRITDIVMKTSKNALHETWTESELQKNHFAEDHQSSDRHVASRGNHKPKSTNASSSIGVPYNWDPYSKGIPLNLLQKSLAHVGQVGRKEGKNEDASDMQIDSSSVANDVLFTDVGHGPEDEQECTSPKSLKDAVKPKHRRKNQKNCR